MKCQIISIGNELLIGDTVNTNGSWLGEIMTENGLDVTQIHTISDGPEQIRATIRSAISSSNLVITTGGLGPTHDDITKKAVAELFDCKLVINESVLKFIKKIFKKRNIPFTESNYYQAEVPDCCRVLFNEQGTAPGMLFEQQKSMLVVLPGVPFEMKNLVKNKVLPEIRKVNVNPKWKKSHYLITAGIGESTLSDKLIGDLSDITTDSTTVAYLPNPRGTTIRINATGNSEEEAEEQINKTAAYIREKAEAVIIGEGKGLTLSEVVGKELKDNNLTLSVAESCTGGFLSNALTDIPGSSHYFTGGIIAYSNDLKINRLGVSKEAISRHGAVSKEVALQMAEGAAQKCGTDIGLSTTGIAGPGGGSEEKPVGTVWVGYWSTEAHFALKANFSNNRLVNKERTAAVAMETLRRTILGISEMPYSLQKYSA